MRGHFTLTGLDAYLEAFAKAGQDVDQVIRSVMAENVEPAREAMKAQLQKSSETWTGATEKTLFSNEPEQEGNYIFIQFGADTSQDPAALYKEYGTARQAAEPFLRPTLTKFKREMRAMLKKVAIEMGLQV